MPFVLECPFWTRSFAVLTATAWLAVPSLITAQNQGQNQDRPPVSWVNSQLPDGPGLSHHILQSPAMGHDVGYVVWTPPGYDATGTTRYPVIYFLHGMGGNESADAAGFSGLLARGLRAKTMPPVLCVFPNGGRSGYRGDVEAMIIRELIPLIDRTYPTKNDPHGRAVAGFSMGGAGAVRLSLLHPELFSAVGSWGGGLGRGREELLPVAEAAATTLLKHKCGFLLINGDQDRPDAFASLAEVLQKKGIDHEVVVLDSTPHNLGLYYEKSGGRMIEFLGGRWLP